MSEVNQSCPKLPLCFLKQETELITDQLNKYLACGIVDEIEHCKNEYIGQFFLRNEIFLSVFYLDDSLLIGTTQDECANNVEQTLQVLTKAGFILNYEKSWFVPTQNYKILKFHI